MNIPSDLNYIQLISTRVCNCDENGFDPNGSRDKVIYTYKSFQGEQIRKVKTGDRAPFWCMLLVFTQYDGKFFLSPIVVHQSTEYSEYIHFNIPLERTFHHTTYGYIDRGGWLKVMTKFSNICGASPVNNQIIFFGVKCIHFYNRSLIHMEH